ncbi:MAG: SH3 domain-containing protein [Treponema sp.]|jgi:hypothetical protein|nr:SH3 domain-containing protein [Treponema sp.]
MKTQWKNLLLLFIVILLFSCNKSANDKKEQAPVNLNEVIPNAFESPIIVDKSMLQTGTVMYYVTNNIYLYENADISSPIMLLPRFSALKILEYGETETIDNITAPWIKITSQSGYTGWCFSGFVSQVENNIAEEATLLFKMRSRGVGTASFPFDNRRETTSVTIDNSRRSNVSSLETIILAQGYYTQQSERWSSSSRSPEILTLVVEGENVLIREIDIVDNKTIVRNEITLTFNGNTFVHNDTKLEIQNEKLQIVYNEHKPERYTREVWDFDMPYTFAGDLNSPVSYNVMRLTTDYLRNFTGEYVFDSYEIIDQSEPSLLSDRFIQSIENASIFIVYNRERKCLAINNRHINRISSSDFSVNFNNDIDFTETAATEPFYWLFGEGAGFIEVMLFFYKGGIIFYFDASQYSALNPEETYESVQYVIFFKPKNIPNLYLVDTH